MKFPSIKTWYKVELGPEPTSADSQANAFGHNTAST